MLISVVVPAYNSEKTIKRCLDSLFSQSFDEPYEIVVVDDGSKDKTAEIVKEYPKVKYVFQKNAGPAAARNMGWQTAKGEIVVFTDSDCVLDKNWLKEMVEPINNKEIAAVGGVYDKSANEKSLLANLIGEEIKYRYSKIGKYTDAHGSYSLAVRKDLLKELNGFNEFYPVATAEDFDLCYRITALGYKIFLNNKAKLAHHHPEKLWRYLKTQFRHGFYRVKLYRDNPKKAGGDKYSGNAVYQVALSGLFVLFLPLVPLVSIAALVGLILLQLDLIAFLLKTNGLIFALEDAGLQILRGFAWLLGMITGLLSYNGFTKQK